MRGLVLIVLGGALALTPACGVLDTGGNCGDDPPGCTEGQCGLTCGGTTWACEEGGDWHVVGGCDWCLHGADAGTSSWRWDQQVTGSCPAAIVAPAHVEIDLAAATAVDEYATVTVIDPTTLAVTSSSGFLGAGYGTCNDQVTFAFSDVWTIDGVDQPVSGTYSITATGPGRNFADQTLDGSFSARVDGCDITGTASGSWGTP